MKTKLTMKVVSDFKCENGKAQSFLWDTEAPGLGIRCTKTGSKAYIFRAKFNGENIRVTIGNPLSWTLNDARTVARNYRTQCDKGIDPRRHKREEIKQSAKEAEANRIEKSQLQLLWDIYLDENKKYWGTRHYTDHLNLSKKGGEKKVRGTGKTLSGPLYPILQLQLQDISSNTLKNWIEKESSTRPNPTRQAFEAFRAFWRWAAERPNLTQYIDVNIVNNSELKKAVPRRKARKHDSLEKSQLYAWFQSINTLSNPTISAYLQALLLTGARRDEMAELKWEHVDFKWNHIWLKDKVEGDEIGRKIPLTPHIKSLLETLPRHNEWVFSSERSASGHLEEPSKAHKKALKLAGIEHVSIHGLRRSFASLAEWVEMPTGIAAQIMGHKPNATAEKHYIERPIDLLAIWHTKLEAWILEQTVMH